MDYASTANDVNLGDRFAMDYASTANDVNLAMNVVLVNI